MPTAKVLIPTYVQKEVEYDYVEFINTGDSITMAETKCNGHDGVLGYENPKASVRVGNRYFVLCCACWKQQGLSQSKKE